MKLTWTPQLNLEPNRVFWEPSPIFDYPAEPLASYAKQRLLGLSLWGRNNARNLWSGDHIGDTERKGRVKFTGQVSTFMGEAPCVPAFQGSGKSLFRELENQGLTSHPTPTHFALLP